MKGNEKKKTEAHQSLLCGTRPTIISMTKAHKWNPQAINLKSKISPETREMRVKRHKLSTSSPTRNPVQRTPHISHHHRPTGTCFLAQNGQGHGERSSRHECVVPGCPHHGGRLEHRNDSKSEFRTLLGVRAPCNRRNKPSTYQMTHMSTRPEPIERT